MLPCDTEDIERREVSCLAPRFPIELRSAPTAQLFSSRGPMPMVSPPCLTDRRVSGKRPKSSEGKSLHTMYVDFV
jgi:hypothetical protein